MLIAEIKKSYGYDGIEDGAGVQKCPNGQIIDPGTGKCVSYPVITPPTNESIAWMSNIITIASFFKFFL
jgi:hypothetical protein